MKTKVTFQNKNGVKEREIDYIPIRFILAILLIILETIAVIGITLWCGANIPYFYILMFLTEIYCVLRIINSKENPDYKIPWLVFVLVVPVAGFMIYFMFYNRMLSKKQIKRNKLVQEQHFQKDDSEVLNQMKQEDKYAFQQRSFFVKCQILMYIRIPLRSIMIWERNCSLLCWRI